MVVAIHVLLYHREYYTKGGYSLPITLAGIARELEALPEKHHVK